jgi:hypothetical protein
MLRIRKTSNLRQAPQSVDTALPFRSPQSVDTACMKYYYKNKEDFDRLNLECEDRPWEGDFNDAKDYSPEKMEKYINKYFIFDKSPFKFEKDYQNKTMDKLCNTKSFELNPSQKFLGMFINNNTDFTGILVNHGLGSGKTTTSIIIGEAMKSHGFVDGQMVKLKGRSPFKVFIVAPKNVQEQFIQEIVGSIKKGVIQSATAACVISTDSGEGYRQFYVGSQNANGTYHYGPLRELEELEKRNPKNPRIILLKDKIRASVSTVYEIMTHDRFLNQIMKTVEKNGVYAAEPIFTNKLNINNDYFHSPNSLLIIDEIHTLVREYSDKAGSNYRKLYHTLMFYARQRENGLPAMKIVLLTGTPIYDNPHEAALILNLLRPRMPFPTSKDKFKELFITKEGDMKNKELFKYMCSGYVSYFKGGNPNGFPFRRNYMLYHRMRNEQEASYISSFTHEFEKERKLLKTTTREDEEKPSTYYQLSTQKCNIAYPTKQLKYASAKKEPERPKGANEVRGRSPIGPKGPKEPKKKRTTIMLDAPQDTRRFASTETALPFRRLKFGEDDDVEDDDVEDEEVKNKPKHITMFSRYLKSIGSFDAVLDEAEKWSLKFAKIVRLIYKTPGPVFIYTRYVGHGILGIVSILNALGWNFLNSAGGERSYAVWSPGALSSLGLIDGLISIEPNQQDSYIKRMKSIFNSPENKDGSLCKVLISNVVEGISLRRVTQVHVCEPWWNMSEMEQIVARAIRFCSHSDIPDKYVDVYYHASALKSYPKKDPHIAKFAGNSSLSWLTINQQMYLTAIRKQTLNNQFEQAMKESAIDCTLNKYGNIVRLEKITMQGPLSVENLYYDRTTNSYYSVEAASRLRSTPEPRILIRGVDLNYGEKIWPATKLVYNNMDITQAIIKDEQSGLDRRRRSLDDMAKPLRREPNGSQTKFAREPNGSQTKFAREPNGSQASAEKPLLAIDLSIIIPENIKCSDQNNLPAARSANFEELFHGAILRGEEPSAWKYCYDSYRKNALLPQLILKYNLYEWGIGGKFMDCLYNGLLDPTKYNLSKIEEKKLENFLISKQARLNNTQRYKDILAKNKINQTLIDSLNYPQLEILAKDTKQLRRFGRRR